MFVRFVVFDRHSASGVREGLFQAAERLRRSGEMSNVDDDRVAAIREWFNLNLERPSRFNRSSRHNRKNKAISWFKSGAKRHITKIRELQVILESYGVLVEMVKTRRPGYVVYEDAFQITAEPFRDTAT